MTRAESSVHRTVAFSACVAVAALLILGSTAASVQAQLPGPNVNMISVDKYLQKQNEIDLTISPRNPCHIVGAANDYRTVDNKGLNVDGEIGDSWIGLYISTDCGETWLNYLMPGYRVNYTTAADPIARFGPGGGLFISHMQFNRGTNVGKIAVARYFDYNNVEGVPKAPAVTEDQSDPTASPIGYLGTLDVATGSTGRFLDKPSIAVTAGAGPACTVDGVTMPATNVYVAWSEFTGNGTNPQRSKVYFARSTNCGRSLAGPATKLSEGDPLNQGTAIAVHPTNPNIIYVAWRQVAAGKVPDAILFARSSDGGRTFTNSQPVTYLDGASIPAIGLPFRPYDQDTTSTTFRTLGYPAMVVDETGRAYLAVSARIGEVRGGQLPSDLPEGGSPVNLPTGRILITSTSDGLRWEPPIEVDNPAQDSPANGHQFMPAMAYAGGRLNLTWYDLKYDESGVFKAFADEKDAIVSGTRHTLDVRGAQAPAGTWPPSFSVYGVSELGAQDPKQKVSLYYAQKRTSPPTQLNFNRPNLKLYAGGTKPFIGDYIGTAGVQYVPGSNGQWLFNGRNADSANAVLRTFQTAWTDNRDAIVGAAGESSAPNPNLDYLKPGSVGANSCSLDTAEFAKRNSRNANVYTSRITPGLYLAALGNTKPTDQIERAYAIQVENGTGADMTVRLSFAAPAGVKASFTQPAASGTNIGALEVSVGKYSSTARSIYVAATSSTMPYPRIDVLAEQLVEPPAAGEVPVTPMRAAIVLNGDPTNQLIRQPGNTTVPIVGDGSKDTHTPRVENPRVENPRVENPRVENQNPREPRVENPRVENPRVENPRVENPRVENPRVENPRVENPRVENPRVENPRVENASFTDITYEVTNDGNTTSAFTLDFRTSTPTAGYAFQLMAWRPYLQPTVGDDCQLKYTEVPQVFYNEMLAPEDVSYNGILVAKRPTVVIRPGESIRWTVRAFDTHSEPGSFQPFCTQQTGAQPGLTDCTSQVTMVATAQAVSTGRTVPEVSSSPAWREGENLIVIQPPSLPLPSGEVGVSLALTFTAAGGTGPYFWEVVGVLPPGMALANGVVSGTPTADGTFVFALRVTDSAGQSDTRTFVATIAPATGPAPLVIVSSTLADGLFGAPYTATLTASGGTSPYTWSRTTSDPPLGLSFSSAGVLSGMPLVAGVYTFPVRVVDSSVPPQSATGNVQVAITAPPPFVVVNTNNSGPGSLRQAISDANSNPGRDTIIFSIPGAGVHTIAPLSALPAISQPVVVDGTTQGAAPGGTPLIELAGDLAGTASGLTLVGGGTATQPGSVIRGLVINRFSRHGIYVVGGGWNTIQGNLIGTNATGTAALGNSEDGIQIISTSPHNTIGGFGVGERNVISGNATSGIFVGGYSSNVAIIGNHIGTNLEGTAAIGNGTRSGVTLSLTSNAEIAGNVISGNSSTGIEIVSVGTGAASNNHVYGNYIGTNAAGSAAIPNQGGGIRIAGGAATGNIIGGLGTGEGNVVSGNVRYGIFLSSDGNQVVGNALYKNRDATGYPGTADGITVAFPYSAWIYHNSIFLNDGLGTDFWGVGPGGGSLNFPVLSSATSSGSETIVSGSVDVGAGLAGSTIRIEFFSNDVCDPSGYGEGQTWLGYGDVVAAPSGATSFSVSLPYVVPGKSITAVTHSSPTGGATSEFSACRAVTGGTGAHHSGTTSYSVNGLSGATVLMGLEPK